MSTIDPSELLRPGLLRGVSIVLAGPATAGAEAGGRLTAAVHAACAELGARMSELPPAAEGSGAVDEAGMDAAVDRALDELGRIDMLVLDAAGLFSSTAQRAGGEQHDPIARACGSGREMLVACLEASWNVTRAVANRAFLPGGRGGRIVYLAPAPGAEAAETAPHADAARAGLENLARTLSIEWARHGIMPVTIVPGAATGAGEVAALTAYLASPAGAYFSGCLLDLRGPGQA